MTNDEIINIASETGRLLLIGGAESFRTEDTVERIGNALGLPLTCYVTLTAVMVSEKNGSKAKVIKAKPGAFNLRTVDEINTLSRALTDKKISDVEFIAQLNQIKHHIIDYPSFLKIISAGLVSMAPMLVAKATFLEYVLMFVTGLLGYLAYYLTAKRSTTPYAPEFIGGFAIGVFAILGTFMNGHVTPSTIVLGAVMPLVPGLAITNALREMVRGDVISGIVRTVNSMIVLTSLAIGVWIAIELMNMI
ncbi:threonine/serine ThrE exporter family protein [Weissella soli]|uniref:threonine/serine ThrE exporter family protein n=1 Tax=Weissella soli TaxID=155866 RepID=UPI003C7258D3